MNQSYILEDEWKIIESGFEPDRVKGSESIFSIGNGAMGQRPISKNNIQVLLFREATLRSHYPDKPVIGENGYPEYFASTNAPNWIGIDLIVNQAQ